jgi:hypothetical protein
MGPRPKRVPSTTTPELTNLPSFGEIVAAVEATGAPEVALFAGAAESVAALLRQRGLDAYALGPPQQMTLPAGK